MSHRKIYSLIQPGVQMILLLVSLCLPLSEPLVQNVCWWAWGQRKGTSPSYQGPVVRLFVCVLVHQYSTGGTIWCKTCFLSNLTHAYSLSAFMSEDCHYLPKELTIIVGWPIWFISVPQEGKKGHAEHYGLQRTWIWIPDLPLVSCVACSHTLPFYRSFIKYVPVTGGCWEDYMS